MNALVIHWHRPATVFEAAGEAWRGVSRPSWRPVQLTDRWGRFSSSITSIVYGGSNQSLNWSVKVAPHFFECMESSVEALPESRKDRACSCRRRDVEGSKTGIQSLIGGGTTMDQPIQGPGNARRRRLDVRLSTAVRARGD